MIPLISYTMTERELLGLKKKKFTLRIIQAWSVTIYNTLTQFIGLLSPTDCHSSSLQHLAKRRAIPTGPGAFGCRDRGRPMHMVGIKWNHPAFFGPCDLP